MPSIDTLPTVSEAKLVIDNNYQRFLDKKFINELSLDIIGYSVANEVQLRDYLLGYPMESNDFMTAFEYIAYLTENVAEYHRAPFHAVLASFLFESGLKDEANASLDKCEALSPNYSLAGLLRRVIEANWSPNNFMLMRESTHGKVVKQLTEMASLKITADTLA